MRNSYRIENDLVYIELRRKGSEKATDVEYKALEGEE